MATKWRRLGHVDPPTWSSLASCSTTRHSSSPRSDAPSSRPHPGRCLLLPPPARVGARFRRVPALTRPGFAELARNFTNADRLFRSYVEGRMDASPVRCWPHHSDLGALLTTLEPQSDGPASTVGFGLSPGDDALGEPYF